MRHKTKSWIAVLLCFLILMPVGIVNADNAEWSFSGVDYLDGLGVISGTFGTASGISLSAELVKQGVTPASPQRVTVATGENGLFFLFFPVELAAYTLSVEAEGSSTNLTLDLTGFSELMGTASPEYHFTDISYRKEYISLCGNHGAANGSMVNVYITEEDGSPAYITHSNADNNSFELRFQLPLGNYNFSMRTGDNNVISATVTIPAFVSTLVPAVGNAGVGNDETEKAVSRFLNYADVLEGMIAACEVQGLEVAYEKAQVAIIRKLSQYLLEYSQLSTALSEYEDSFTRVYQETRETLTEYLKGEKKPQSTTKYQTGAITFDGNTVLGNTLTNGKTEEKPVFFVGYGPWEGAAEAIPFFSEIGMNIIQTEIEMHDVVVPGIYQYWTDTSYATNAEFSLDKTNVAKGTYSFKMVNNNLLSGKNNIRTLSQKIKVTPNTTYNFGLLAKGSGIAEASPSAAWFSVRGWNVNGRVAIHDSDDWVEYQSSYTTASGETELEVILFTEGYTDEVYIDEVYVKKAGTGVNLVKNHGFEMIPAARNAQEQAFLDSGYFINHEKIDWLQGVLSNAERNHVLVDLIVGINYLPSFILEEDPSMTAHTEYFTPFATDHPKLRQIFLMWVDLLGTIASEYDSVHTLCILGEPEIHANTSTYYLDDWHQFLQDRYGTVSAMNAAYGTTYAAFDSVEMPTELEKSVRFNDYRIFNDGLLSEFIQWFASSIKEKYPGLKIHTKMMDYMNYSWPRFIQGGTDWARQESYTDLNGCDSFGYIDWNDEQYSDRNRNMPPYLRMAWYDYMTSVKNAPVWDTESHLLNDYNAPRFDDIVPYHYGTDVWNGAVHGRGAQVIWLWDLRKGSLPGGWSNYVNANAVLRPDAVFAASKAAMDLNRLSEEISALQDEKAKVGILYSRTTLSYNDYGQQMFTDLDACYKEIITGGQKVGFVVDARPEDMYKYQLLVVPETTHVTKEMVEEILAYLQNGGEVLLVGNDCLKYDENDKVHDSTLINNIYSLADTTSTVKAKLQEMKLSDVMLIDVATGQKVEDIEWSYTNHNGKTIVNIVNYHETTARQVKVLYCGKEVQTMKELRSGEVTDNGILEVKPYQPLLVSFAPLMLNLTDEGGNVIESDIDSLQSGIISCSTDVDGTVILALYESERLVKVSLGAGSIKVDLENGKDYRLMATVWDMDTLHPLIASTNITN